MSTAAASLTSGERYVGYSYAYPHKTAYRPLAPARPLDEIWSSEPRDALFLYLHLPFCRVRCGFCNLFTTTTGTAADGDGGGLVQRYLTALQREARAVSQALPGAGFARIAVGGGTPTLLAPSELDQLFDVIESLGASTSIAPTSIEASPDTATRDRLEVLRARGVSRLSVGVQTFDEEEAKAIGRPQRRGDAVRALALARQVGFAVLNVDLIYGGDAQTVASWLRSLRDALSFEPEEIYLYPLYVRPLTGLGRSGGAPPEDQRPAAYRAARDLLGSAGYTQVSMRMFRRAAGQREAGAPSYCCQSDGMVGLGAGARSYTRALHYSTEYAVGRSGVRAIIEEYVQRPEAELRRASYGFALDAGERRRRWVIQSLLLCEGLDRAAYRQTFGGDVLGDLPQLDELLASGLATASPERLWLSADGIERSDAIGPWLASDAVRARMESYTWR
jgi:oxygen-independent coproporphyrinogen-3 oxidase